MLALFFLDEPITASVWGGVLTIAGAVLAMLIRTKGTAEPPM